MDLTKYVAKTENKMNDVQKLFAFKLYRSVALKTPVDTGRARGNWNVAEGSADMSVDEEQKQLQYNSPDQLPIKDDGKDKTVYISNNLPYIVALEYGHSKQAPNGMVGVTMASAERYMSESVNEVRSK